MNDMLRPSATSAIAAVYDKEGYFFPHDVISEAEASRLLVSTVSGEDRYGHFEHMPAPTGRLLAEDWERARRNAEMKREILYTGVKSELVKENRRG